MKLGVTFSELTRRNVFRVGAAYAMVSWVISISLLCLVVAGCNGDPPRPAPVEYSGKLKPEILSSGAGPTSILESASEDAVEFLGKLVPDSASVSVAELEWDKGASIVVYLITPIAGDRFVLVDADDSGSLDDSEKSVLVAAPQDGARYDASVNLALEEGPVANYDLTVSLFDFSGFEIPDGKAMPEPRLMAGRAQVEGIVDVNGRSIMVRVPYSFETQGLATGSQTVDANYDGEYDTWLIGRELVYAGEGISPPIFRVDDTYVSVGTVDVESQRITLLEHPAEDYQRIELEVGNNFPDFEYADLNGNAHTLSEFRGKYVLLNVWGSWCHGCIEDLPHHKRIYTEYKDRGFVILSLNNERSKTEAEYGEALEKVREFVVENDIDWPQSNEASVRELIAERLYIRAYPTSILLDPAGKIVLVPGNNVEWRDREEKLDEALELLMGPG